MSGPETAFASVGVVGAGLIGGSVALRLHDLGRPVVVDDPDPATRALVTEAGLTLGDPHACELVVLATPLDLLEQAMAPAASTSAVVVDVGSVKAGAAAAAGRVGLGSRHVGLHPMSGTEQAGFAHASAGLLTGVTWAAVRPPADGGPVPDETLARVVAWVAETFEASVLVLDAEAHDRAVALVSHLPHAVANALLAVVEGAASPAAALLAAGSFRDGTRVAGTHPDRTLNMLAENRAALVPALDALLDELADYRRLLAADDATSTDELRTRLAQVAGAAPAVRSPELAWRDLPEGLHALSGAIAGPAPALVRRAPDGPLAVADLP